MKKKTLKSTKKMKQYLKTVIDDDQNIYFDTRILGTVSPSTTFVLMYLLLDTDNLNVKKCDISKYSGVSQYLVRKGIKELIENGYIIETDGI